MKPYEILKLYSNAPFHAATHALSTTREYPSYIAYIYKIALGRQWSKLRHRVLACRSVCLLIFLN